MRLAVVGSRDYPHEDFVRLFIRRLAARGTDHVIVSGGARGTDTWVIDEAEEQGFGTHVIPVLDEDWEREGKQAGKTRNTFIVMEVEAVVAFWNGISRGTMDTIRKAHEAGLPVRVFGPARQVLPVESLLAT